MGAQQFFLGGGGGGGGGGANCPPPPPNKLSFLINLSISFLIIKFPFLSHDVISEQSEPLSRVFNNQPRNIYIYGGVRTFLIRMRTYA